MDIQLHKVNKSYGNRQVLRDFACHIPGGSICAVMAPSGTGKTTLLRLILGLEAPDSGSITGIPNAKAALFQEDRLCPQLSVLGNLRMALPRCPESKMWELLTRLGLADSMEKPAGQLSGGMSRRAALARALLHDGQLLILDEPFSGLDEENRLHAADCILQYRRGRTLLFVTHREEDLPLLQAVQCIRLQE